MYLLFATLLHLFYLCIEMLKKVQNLSVVWVFTYLWVILSLPLHHHITDEHVFTTTSCTHSDNDAHKDHQVVIDDCAVCFNLHMPHATADFHAVEYSFVIQESTSVHNGIKPSFWHNIDTHQLSNKDPPLSIIA